MDWSETWRPTNWLRTVHQSGIYSPYERFHVSPVTNRQAIVQQGLVPGSDGHVWLHNNFDQAHAYGLGQQDVWKVNTQGLPITEGQGNWDAGTVPSGVGPERLQLMREGRPVADPLAAIWKNRAASDGSVLSAPQLN